jgi:hypothetical protein
VLGSLPSFVSVNVNYEMGYSTDNIECCIVLKILNSGRNGFPVRRVLAPQDLGYKRVSEHTQVAPFSIWKVCNKVS